MTKRKTFRLCLHVPSDLRKGLCMLCRSYFGTLACLSMGESFLHKLKKHDILVIRVLISAIYWMSSEKLKGRYCANKMSFQNPKMFVFQQKQYNFLASSEHCTLNHLFSFEYFMAGLVNRVAKALNTRSSHLVCDKLFANFCNACMVHKIMTTLYS